MHVKASKTPELPEPGNMPQTRSGSRISQRGYQAQRRGYQPIIWPKFPENCMKMQKNRAGMGVGASNILLYISATVDPWLCAGLLRWCVRFAASTISQKLIPATPFPFTMMMDPILKIEQLIQMRG